MKMNRGRLPLKILDNCVQVYLIFTLFNFKSLNASDQSVWPLNNSNQPITSSSSSSNGSNQLITSSNSPPVTLSNRSNVFPPGSKSHKSANQTRIRIENCYSVLSKFENVVNFLGLNISLYDFQQIINLKAGNVYYFGRTIAQEGTSLTLTCVRRPTAPLASRTEWHLNAEPIEQHYSTRNHQKSKKSTTRFYQTEQWFCRNLNLAVHKLTIKKVEFTNQGEYECIDPAAVDASKQRKYLFVQVLIVDWDLWNVDFLSQVYYDILPANNTPLVKYCPLSSPSWYKWARKLATNGQARIDIHEPGLYHCRSELLNRRINFYVFASPTIQHFSASGSVAVGGKLKFECNASAYPLAELQWYIGKSKIDIGRQKFERFEFNENSNNHYPNSMLTLHNLTKFDDENTITCEARNQVENVWQEVDVTEVLRVDDIKKYRLNLKGSTDVDCPNVAIAEAWYFQNQKIDPDTDKRFKIKNSGKTLEIRPDVDLEGEYKCEFKNKNHTLTVVTPPRIHLEEIENCRIDLKSVHAYGGRKFRIDCRSNNPSIKYNMRWLKNGEEIKSEVTNSLSLEMSHLKESAKANYTCQASNDVGHFNIEFYLRVRNSNAYLWPVSGIIAELVILVTVIWWSEKNKTDQAVED